MNGDPEEISASEFKAKCLALLDEVALTGRSVIVTKRGKPVAKLTPLEGSGPRSLIGSVIAEDDIIAPTGESWSADR